MSEISGIVLNALEWSKLQKFLAEHNVNEIGRNFSLSLAPFCFEQNYCDQMARASIELQELYQNKGLRIPLLDISDLSSLMKRVERSGNIYEDEFVELVCTHKSVQNAAFFVGRYAKDCRDLTSLIGHIDMMDEWADRHFSMVGHDGKIADDASNDLKALRRLKKNIEKEIRDKLEERLKKRSFKEFLQDEYVTLREGRYVLPIKSNFKGKVPGIIHDLSKTEQTIFLEPNEVVELNNKLKMTEREIFLEIERILQQVVLETKPYVEIFLKNQDLIALADFLNATSLLVERWNTEACCVEWGRSSINMETLRHPLLAIHDKVVPNSLSWSEGLVLTGPNTGGKTVLLKSIGLAYCMARSGLPICAKKVSFPENTSNLFVDIGDDQSIDESLSTFSSHLRLYKEMLDCSQENDLVLIDEIATGTDPEEGASLARALFEELLEMKVKVFVTTHYGTMKHFAMSDSRCRIAAMSYDWKAKKPTFEIQMDIPGESSALDTAERLGIRKSVIERAKKSQGVDSEDLKNAVERLERSRETFLEKKNELDLKIKNAESREKEARNQLVLYRKKIKETVQEEAKKILKEFSGIKSSLSEKLKLLKTKDAEKESFKVFETIAQQTDKLKSLSADTDQNFSHKVKIDLASLKVGLNVEIAGLGSGVVEEFPSVGTQNPMVKVKVGSLSTRVSLERLFFPTKAKLTRIKEVRERKKLVHPGTYAQTAQSKRKKASTANGVCDVRGRSVDDAMRKIELSLNELARGDLANLSIIHGHGTGTLKENIRGYLNQRSELSYRSGTWPGEGGDGVTIVEAAD